MINLKALALTALVTLAPTAALAECEGKRLAREVNAQIDIHMPAIRNNATGSYARCNALRELYPVMMDASTETDLIEKRARDNWSRNSERMSKEFWANCFKHFPNDYGFVRR